MRCDSYPDFGLGAGTGSSFNSHEHERADKFVVEFGETSGCDARWAGGAAGKQQQHAERAGLVQHDDVLSAPRSIDDAEARLPAITSIPPIATTTKQFNRK
jgi:hypothetical protein